MEGLIIDGNGAMAEGLLLLLLGAGAGVGMGTCGRITDDNRNHAGRC